MVVVMQKGYDGEGSVPYINKKGTKTRRQPSFTFVIRRQARVPHINNRISNGGIAEHQA